MFDLRGWIEQRHRGPASAAWLWGRFGVFIPMPVYVWGVPQMNSFCLQT